MSMHVLRIYKEETRSFILILNNCMCAMGDSLWITKKS